MDSKNPQIILEVCVFLYYLLNTVHFGALVMTNDYTSSHFLREYLLPRSFEEFKMVCKRYNGNHDLNKEILRRDSMITNNWESNSKYG